MEIVLVLLGSAVVVLTLADLLSTTLSVASGDGLVSGRIADTVWRLVLRLRLSHRALRRCGLLIVGGLVAGWAITLWAGWSLVFLGAGDGVVNSSTQQSAGAGDRIYYAGYLVSTLGNGDLAASGTGWQLATVLASISGLVAVTLAITFLVPVVSGVVQRRQLATVIGSLGKTPAELLRRSWDGTDFSHLADHLSALLPELLLMTQRHMAYPVLHYFHSAERHGAIAPMVAVLDETVLILRFGVRQPGISHLTLDATREGIAELLRLLEGSFIPPSAEEPPAPQLQWARQLGAAVHDADTFDRVLRDQEPRRRVLRGFVESDGWQWSDVYESDADTRLDVGVASLEGLDASRR